MNTSTARKSIIKEYYSTKSDYWASLYNPSGSAKNWTRLELARRKDLVFDLIGGIRTSTLQTALDVGCGSGNYLAQLEAMGFGCTGADVSGPMLELARNELNKQSPSDTTLINADCCNLPLDDHSFDLVLSIGVLEYLDSEADALQEIKRLLTADGYAIVTFPNLCKLRNLVNPYYYIVRIWTYLLGRTRKQSPAEATRQGNGGFDYDRSTSTRYSLPKARKILQQSGFDLIEMRSCCFGPFSLWKPYHSPETSIKTSDHIEALLKYKPFGFLHFLANSWIILIKPTTERGSTK